MEGTCKACCIVYLGGLVLVMSIINVQHTMLSRLTRISILINFVNNNKILQLAALFLSKLL